MTNRYAFLAILITTPFGLACGGDDSDPGPDPTALGPYAVGYQRLELTYAPSGSTGPRTVPVEVWYPADPPADVRPARYAVGGVVEVPTEVALAAPPPAEGSPFPVVVYSHGNGGVGLVGYPYGEYFASHGWVVVAPDHVGNTALDFLTDAAVSRAQSALDRPQDLSAALDWLEGTPGETGTSLEGVADTGQVVAIGHSFGGYTVLALAGTAPDRAQLADGCPNPEDPGCAVLEDAEVQAAFEAGFEDDRVAAIVPQAPAILFEESALAPIDVPAMLQTGRLDATTTQEGSAEPAWRGLDGVDDVWVEMETGAHFTFLSICDDLTPEQIALFQRGAEEDGCGSAFIPPSEALPVLNAYALAFARLHALGEPEAASVWQGPPLRPGFEITLR